MMKYEANMDMKSGQLVEANMDMGRGMEGIVVARGR